MTKALTQAAIEKMKPTAARREIPDGLVAGLYLVQQPSGARSWAVRYRHAGKPAKFTLGPWPAVTIAKAREFGRDAIIAVKQGRDPSKERKAAKAKTIAAAADTVKAICEEYLLREGKKLRTVHQRERILERLVYPVLGAKQIEAVKRSDIIRLLDQIEDENGPRMAHEVLAILRKIMNWYATRSDEFRSPIIRGMGRVNAKERARARILTDDELRHVWAATSAAEPFPSFIRFLLLTAARRAEAAAMRWSELDGADWTLPAARNKTKVDLVRPLSTAARAVLARLPRIGPFVFSRTGDSALSGISFFKTEFDIVCGVTDWRPHDLRRTARSLMSRAGVLSDHAERCLGHVIGGVRGVYDRYEYHAEKKHAYEALAAQIERIVSPRKDNVIPVRRR
jgi:integrase